MSVVDGREVEDGVHRFRIRIWDKGSGAVIYDDEPGADPYAVATHATSGGSIVVHK